MHGLNFSRASFRLSLFAALTLMSNMGEVAKSAEIDVWIGTATHGESKSRGIYRATFDTSDGKLTTPTLAAEVQQPGFLALNPFGQVLYSTGTVDGEPTVVAYRIVRQGNDASLTKINSQPTGDGDAAHISTDRTGRVLFSVQYGGGSVAVFPLADDGSIGTRSQLVDHEGSSRVDAARQEGPHPHWVGTSPDNRFAFVSDLGLDRVVIYRLDAKTGTLSPHGFGEVPPGSGPRHMKFHPNGKWIYVLNELTLTVTAFAYDSDAGSMTTMETVPTIPEWQNTNHEPFSGSEIRVHPSGKFVYAANRGHDTVSVFHVDNNTGKLTFVQCEPIHGNTPRNFNMDPTGQWLIVAGQNSNTLSVFQIDPVSGELTYAQHTVEIPTPICVEFGVP